MTVHTVEVDKVGHKQAFLVSMSFQFANKKIHIFPIICRMIAFRKVDMSIDITDFTDADDLISLFFQVGKDHFPFRQTTVILTVSRTHEIPRFSYKGSGNNTTHFVRPYAYFLTCHFANTVEFFQGNDIRMSRNLKDTVCRCIDNGLFRLYMFRTEASNNFRSRRHFVTEPSMARFFRKRIQ